MKKMIVVSLVLLSAILMTGCSIGIERVTTITTVTPLNKSTKFVTEYRTDAEGETTKTEYELERDYNSQENRF